MYELVCLNYNCNVCSFQADAIIMSDYRSRNDIDRHLKKLLEHAAPNSNDKRHREYVGYINGFLGHFGDEQAFLVGSTAEQTKIRTSNDNSDADFLMVSGRLSIPASELEFRPDMSNFVWVRGEKLSKAKQLGVDMIYTIDENQYLPGEILKVVDPKLFTILRGIYKCVNSTTDSVPGRETRVTTIGEESSVGLARTEFRGLEVIDKDKIPKLKKYFPRRLPPRKHRMKRQKTNEHMESTTKLLELMASFSGPDPENYEGQFAHFTDIAKLLMQRQKEESLDRRGDEPLLGLGGSDDETEVDGPGVNPDYQPSLEDLPTDVRASYEEKTMKDFVPAIRIVGKLPCMDTWFRENGKWLPGQTKRAIYDTTLYVVAKNAPLNPDQRDFCLAFNHAEIMLAEALSPTQRKCLLILKAIYKGVFARIMKYIDTPHKLKSFHLKTALYWVLEETTGSEIWKEENLLGAVRRVLFYLGDALHKQRLLHYFTRSNLFAGLEEQLCSNLNGGIDNIIADPNKGLEQFFALEEEGNPVIVLNNAQLRQLIEMSRDGGVEKEVNVLEEAKEDFERGFEEAKQKKGYVPLNEAINHIMKMYLESEGERKVKEELKIPLPDDLAGSIISGAVGGLLGATAQSSSTSDRSRSSGGQRDQDLGNLLGGLAGQLLQASQRQSSSQSRREQDRQPSTSGQPQQSTGNVPPGIGNLLAGAVNAFLESSNSEETRRAAENIDFLGNLNFLGKPKR